MKQLLRIGIASLSLFIFSCGTEHDSSGGDWEGKPENGETANTSTSIATGSTPKREPVAAAPTPKALTNKDQDSANAAVPAHPTGEATSTPITFIAIDPKWEIADYDENGFEWTAKISKISSSYAEIDLIGPHSLKITGRRLNAAKKVAISGVRVYASDPVKISWSQKEKITFIRNDHTGRCFVDYWLDRFIYDTRFKFEGDCR